MRRFILLALLLVGPAVVPTYLVAQVKHPFTFEDMMKLKRVGEPVPSPDGKWVAFSVVDVSLEANTKTPHVWIVPTAGGESKILIPDQDSDRPRWAPDGKRFLFLSSKSDSEMVWVTEPDSTGKMQPTHRSMPGKDVGQQVWIADFDGASGSVTSTHRLTTFATEADGPIWSPDGKNIVFVSSVYPECAGSPAEELACNAKKLDEVAKSKVKAQIFTRLLYRHWNAYQEGKRSHLFVVSAETLPIPRCPPGAMCVTPSLGSPPRDLTPGDYDSPVFSLGGQDNYAFSPDGQEICYTSNHDKVEATSTNNDLWIVPINVTTPNVATGASPVRSSPAQPQNITADNPASDSTPLYSPDGKYIAYRAQKRPGYESDRFRLMLYERKTGAQVRVSLTESFDQWVGTFAWAPDSKQIFFAGEDKAKSPLSSLTFKREDVVGAAGNDVNIRSTEIKIDTFTGGFNDDIAITPTGKKLLFTRMSIGSPNEIYSGDLWFTKNGVVAVKNVDALCEDDSNAKPKPESCIVSERFGSALTHINDAVLSHVEVSPLQTFWFEGAEKAKVQGFLIKPPNFDPKKKYPVKLLIHGGPQGAWGDDWSFRWNAELFAANGYVVLQINPRGSTGYGQKFIDDINGDWGGRAFEDLMKGLDYAETHYGFIDKDRECALGASYGGYMINWILGHTDRFKCLVSHDGMFNTDSAWGTTEELWFNEWEFKGTPYTNREMYTKWSPHLFAKNFKTPTLVIHGQKDYRLDVSEGFQLFTTLQRMNVPSKMLYFPDEGHWVLKPQNSQLWYKTVNDWVDQWIGDPAKK